MSEKVYPRPLRRTQIATGQVEGIRGNNPRFTIYKGIPYAAPPVGELRWKKPQPPAAWEGIRRCTEFSPASHQCERWGDGDTWADDFCQYEPVRSEDCLYLNVWTPAAEGEHDLPVFVWYHGGAFANGNGAEIHIDGEGYCKRGIVFVSVNYRLGALGYLAHPELSAESPDHVSGNYGLYDQIAALTWVKENIEAFGGDPNCITIGGQSAGAGTCLELCVSPLTEGLFQRMIIQSGFICSGQSNCVPPSMKEGEDYGVSFAREYGCTSIEEMRQIPAEEFGKDQGMMVGRPFLPLNDGIALTEAFIDTMEAGRHRNVDVMMGNTSGEWGVDPEHLLLPDTIRMGQLQKELGRSPAYLYCFTRGLPGPDDPGAIHGAEQWYEFETLMRGWRPFTGEDFDLAVKLTDYFAAFIRTGDPNSGNPSAGGRGNYAGAKRDLPVGNICGVDLPVWKPFDPEDPRCMELGIHLGMIEPNPCK